MSLFNQLMPFQALRAPGRADDNDAERYVAPAYTVKESAEAFGLEVFVPGVARDAVEIQVDQGELVVTARRRWKAPEGWNELFRESADADYRLRLDLGEAVNLDKINAELAQGVLRVTLPKAEELRPRKIEVN